MADNSLPTLVGTDYAAGRRTAGPAPEARGEGGIEAPPQEQQLPDMRATMQPQEPGAGGMEIGESLQRLAADQEKAQSVTWLSSAGTDFELKAQNLLDNMNRQRQPGQMIGDDYKAQLEKLQATSAGTVQNPLLASAYTARTNSAIATLTGQAQLSDFKARDDTTQFNFNQSLNNSSKIISMQPNYDLADQRGQKALGELLTTVQNSPVPLEQRQKMTMDAITGISEATNRTQQQLDGKRWITENAWNLSPEARAGIGDDISRGVRNNNPGNIKSGQGFNGEINPDKDGYAIFNTPEDGLRALAIDLHTKYDKDGLNTINGIVSKYAPPGDNDTAAYVQHVSQQMNMGANQPLNLNDPQQLHSIMTAVIRHENNNAMPYSEQSLGWATNSALGKDNGPPPPSDMDHGGRRTGNALFNVAPYELQQKLISDYVSLQRQEKTIGIQYTAQASQQISDLTENMHNGIAPSDKELSAALQLAGSSMNPAVQMKAEKLTNMAEMTKSANAMSNDQLMKNIEILKAQPQSISRDDALEFYQSYAGKRDEGLKKDGLSYWAAQGNKLPPLDITKPETLQQREQLSTQLSSLYGMPRDNFLLSQDDKPMLNNLLSSARASDRMQTLQNLHQGFSEGAYHVVMDKIRPDSPTTAYAGDMYGMKATQPGETHWFSPNDPALTSTDVANRLLQGEDMINPMKQDKEGTKMPMPPDTEFRTVGKSLDYLGAAGSPEMGDSSFRAMKSYYAWASGRDHDLSGVIKPDRVDEAWQAVQGNTASMGPSGKSVVAPWGMSESDFRDKMQTAYTKQAEAQGVNIKSFPFQAAKFENIPSRGSPMATGAYFVRSGNGYLSKNGKPVIINVTAP